MRKQFNFKNISCQAMREQIYRELELDLMDKKGKEDGKCIMVGLQLNSNGRDLLHWTLSNIARLADRVVAVHVCRDSDLRRTSTVSLIKVLDDYLAACEGMCTPKKVALIGRVSRGNSIQKIIVKEAKICDASMVVLGANKKYSLGNSASLAKYCAKKLPPTTTLLMVKGGKVVFEKSAAKQPPVLGGDTKPKFGYTHHSSTGSEPKVVVPNSSVLMLSNIGAQDITKKKGDLIPEPIPGWPLLRRAVSEELDGGKGTEARNMSVVQWVMSLPTRPSIYNQPHTTSASLDLAKELDVILRAHSSSCKLFHIEELRTITSQFSSENLVGKGGNSRVYKGCLSNGQEAAIKLSKVSREASSDFLLEIDIITSLQHERIVPLIGICSEDTNLITVYKYFSKGSLEENLHGEKAKPRLSWDERFKVAIGVAEALSYLHSGCPRPVIHRDIKSSNILLSDDSEPQLSDFGLAIWAPATSSYLTHNDVVGTFGYLAPEYFMYGRISDKIDVYAFGVLLLELLTGRKPINDENPKGQESLVMWATPILEKGDITDLLDPNLKAKYDDNQMQRMILAGSVCITRVARLRPQMNQILKLLRGEEEIDAWISSHVHYTLKELDCQDDETYPASSFGSHLELALLDVDDDASLTIFEQNHKSYWEEYLKRQWSHSSSFD